MRLLVLLFGLLAACSDPVIIEVQRLAPGGGGAGLGGADAAPRARPTLDVVVRMENDSTGFVPTDLMRLLVNGTDMADEVVLGGLYAVLRLDGPPLVGAPQAVELFKGAGPRKDSYTYLVGAYAGPTLADAAPAEGPEGTVVRLTGTGFLAAAARVFFGGIEAVAVTVVDDANIDATVPGGAQTGLVYVQVGADAAEGIVGFQLLDAGGAPVPMPAVPALFAAFPACGPTETAVEIYGVSLDEFGLPTFNDVPSSRIFGVETVTLPIGDVTRALAVVLPTTDPGAGALLVNEFGFMSNELPFTVK